MPFVSVRLIGGLGNQMSCINAVYKISELYPKYTPILCGSLIDNSCYKHSSSLYFGSFIHLSVSTDIIPNDTWVTVDEESFHLFNWIANDRNVVLSGYFQGFLYLPIMKTLTSLYACSLPSSIHVPDGSVGIHIRRGDYMEHEWLYGNQRNTQYWAKALKYLEQHLETPFRLYVFTNDMEWTKRFMQSYSYSIVYVSELNLKDYQEMMLMTKMDNIIISNSTFSWYGAVLNNKVKTVVCPYPFFFNHKSHTKYYGYNWILLN